jgi:outer membrane protein OmpA-like peptidoglycan-associated protein
MRQNEAQHPAWRGKSDQHAKFTMKHIDLVRTLESTFSQPLLEQLSGKFGLSPDMLGRVVSRASPALVSACMASGATARSTGELFVMIRSMLVNARIPEQFAELVATTTGLKALEDAGHSFALRGLKVSPGVLGDWVAASSGIPTQAACALTGLICAMLSGILKHHVLLEQGTERELPQLLAAQWPSIELHFNDALAQVLGFENVASFRDTIPAQLRVLAGNLQRAAVQAVPAGERPPGDGAAPAEAQPDGGDTKAGRRRRMAPGFFALMLSAIAIVYGAYYFQRPPSPGISGAGQSAQRAASSVASPAAASRVAPAKSTGGPVEVSPVSDAKPAASDAGASGAVSALNSTASDAENASPPSVASPAPLDEKIHPARLVFGVNRVGATVLSATLGSEAEKARLLEILDHGPGAGRYTADVTIDSQAVLADWLAHFDALVPLMRVSRADLTIDGEDIELGGVAGEPKLAWESRIRALFGSSYNVRVFDPAQAVLAATSAFRQAAGSLSDTGPCDPVARVLGLQVIDFARGSGHVPESATGNLEESARLLKSCVARRQMIHLTVQAFSDDIGDASANLDLSTKRADAVRAFLVHAGVPAALLSAQGYGVAQPIASNLTERGRFANRRIVFVEGP